MEDEVEAPEGPVEPLVGYQPSAGQMAQYARNEALFRASELIRHSSLSLHKNTADLTDEVLVTANKFAAFLKGE